jgi:RNA polymerase subunit RPABC4/transcription elongation factor Spt4
MASTRQCSKCGVILLETGASTCPACGTRIGPATSAKWVIALVQIALSTTFMLVFRFPKFLIAIFAGMIVIGTALSGFIKPKTAAQKSAPPKPLSRPLLFKVLSFGIAICALAFVSSLLFGFVAFMNSWDRYQKYEGLSYHKSEFQVTQTYWQKTGRGGIDAYAKGTVEGQAEWMGLRPYLEYVPRSEAELDASVPPGTTIPIYYFPALKGRARVQLVGDLPPAQEGHRDAMNALNYGLIGLAISGGLLFVLLRLRNLCYQKNESAFGATA